MVEAGGSFVNRIGFISSLGLTIYFDGSASFGVFPAISFSYCSYYSFRIEIISLLFSNSYCRALACSSAITALS
jgi:hypothetical protein